MMATLAQLQAWRDRLEDARFSGVRSARDSNGEEITYASDREMARALATLEAKIAAAGTRPASILYLQTSKGT
ncbi:MAG: phage head-tail joining protein [Gemmobacter sp.]